MNIDAIIIGGGACGLMTAVQAGYEGKKVIVLEKNDKPGAKILISGGGRCNYTNLYSTEKNFISENADFCRSAFSQWTVEDTIRFFEGFGIRGQEKTLGQLFPQTNKAADIVKVFTDQCTLLGQQLICGFEVEDIQKTGNGFRVSGSSGGRQQYFEAPKVVIASGGLPIPKMGASDFALTLAQRFGMRLTKTAPALVPLVIGHQDRAWYQAMSGTSVFARVSNERISFEENILFTHWGLSGPAILQLSSYWRGGESFEIDLLPGKNIEQMIGQERNTNGGKLLQTLIGTYLPKKLVDAFKEELPLDIKLASLSKEAIRKTGKIIHHFEVRPAGDKGYEKAEVMRGGIDTSELSSKSLESKKVPGLFFGGECVDVTGWLGGYNFQWAWASGYVIAKNL